MSRNIDIPNQSGAGTIVGEDFPAGDATAVGTAPSLTLALAPTFKGGAPAGTIVGKLSTADPAGTLSFDYQLLDSADSKSFIILADLLVTAVPLLNKTRRSYSLRIKATDWLGFSFTQQVPVTVEPAIAPEPGIDLASQAIDAGLTGLKPTLPVAVRVASDWWEFGNDRRRLKRRVVFRYAATRPLEAPDTLLACPNLNDCWRPETVLVHQLDADAIILSVSAPTPLDGSEGIGFDPWFSFALEPSVVTRDQVPVGSVVDTLTTSDPNPEQWFAFAVDAGPDGAPQSMTTALSTINPRHNVLRKNTSLRVKAPSYRPANIHLAEVEAWTTEHGSCVVISPADEFGTRNDVGLEEVEAASLLPPVEELSETEIAAPLAEEVDEDLPVALILDEEATALIPVEEDVAETVLSAEPSSLATEVVSEEVPDALPIAATEVVDEEFTALVPAEETVAETVLAEPAEVVPEEVPDALPIAATEVVDEELTALVPAEETVAETVLSEPAEVVPEAEPIAATEVVDEELTALVPVEEDIAETVMEAAEPLAEVVQEEVPDALPVEEMEPGEEEAAALFLEEDATEPSASVLEAAPSEEEAAALFLDEEEAAPSAEHSQFEVEAEEVATTLPDEAVSDEEAASEPIFLDDTAQETVSVSEAPAEEEVLAVAEAVEETLPVMPPQEEAPPTAVSEAAKPTPVPSPEPAARPAPARSPEPPPWFQPQVITVNVGGFVDTAMYGMAPINAMAPQIPLPAKAKPSQATPADLLFANLPQETSMPDPLDPTLWAIPPADTRVAVQAQLDATVFASTDEPGSGAWGLGMFGSANAVRGKTDQPPQLDVGDTPQPIE